MNVSRNPARTSSGCNPVKANLNINPAAFNSGAARKSGSWTWASRAHICRLPVVISLLPVFDSAGDSIFAIRTNELYRIPVNREPAAKVYALPGVSKLVGLSRDDPDQLLVVANEPQGPPFAAILSIKTGSKTRIADNGHSDEYRAMLTQLTGWERVYGTTHVYTEDEEKPGAGDSTIQFSDVYLRRGSDAPLNLTNGNGVSSSQPSLSADSRTVVFIRATQ